MHRILYHMGVQTRKPDIAGSALPPSAKLFALRSTMPQSFSGPYAELFLHIHIHQLHSVCLSRPTRFITGQSCCLKLLLGYNVAADLNVLDPLGVQLGAHIGCVLALRMLYSSLSRSSHRTYSSFLHDMGPQLRCFIEPLDVLYFWRQAAGIQDGTPWMAVFAMDEVSVLITDI